MMKELNVPISFLNNSAKALAFPVASQTLADLD
jgi:hypothetical protein